MFESWAENMHHSVITITKASTKYGRNTFKCGPNGFICESSTKVRLCEDKNVVGPAFVCPANTICNEESSSVCENYINYIDPDITRGIRCHRHERIADPSVADCRGYILCIPNKNRFQGIKFKCAGNTVFNGYTRTCSSPDKYKCPIANAVKSTIEMFDDQTRRFDSNYDKLKLTNRQSNQTNGDSSRIKPIDCRNYKFRVTHDNNPVRATYFCPKAPVRGEASVRCTIFSNQFCVTLEKHNEDQFILDGGAAYRKPRM
ncbi:hypothetical protein K1T71_005183 [Dendrolimus kikuchii]|uniref:Uncharacterized protein n=1 Tax=Dendrolimus kikuchii TaxID=765133 RepID=A0ACC1D6G9_9NEOP|nr:hypothetical protein K1T71_005183 [Dendrolimus kikuchii]